MAITKQVDRQRVLAAVADVGIAQIGVAGANGIAMIIPPNAVVLSVEGLTTTVFNSATTDTLLVTDGTTIFINGADIKTAVGVAVTANAPKFYPSGGTITVSAAETGATATAGRTIVTVRYIVVGRGNEVQAS